MYLVNPTLNVLVSNESYHAKNANFTHQQIFGEYPNTNTIMYQLAIFDAHTNPIASFSFAPSTNQMKFNTPIAY